MSKIVVCEDRDGELTTNNLDSHLDLAKFAVGRLISRTPHSEKLGVLQALRCHIEGYIELYREDTP